MPNFNQAAKRWIYYGFAVVSFRFRVGVLTLVTLTIMWSALVNGGGGAGGGYVQSQGWEFVPCHRMERADRGRGKSRSPLRRISSPPTVFSHIYEPQFSPSHAAGGGESGAGDPHPLDVLRGHMGAGPELQTQHTRLKKKFEDLKKRHVQDKEDWLREKESLLREVADIQGGENRRILLDLKIVLEEVQAEVKREEEKRSELQLQYTRDRCAWELEKAELKCRIAQLEARETTSLVSRGVQAATGPGTVASQSPREQHQEASSLRREREEQRRILVDTQSAAMDLRCRLELNERDWLREKAELLERFDVERKEWEGQLRDMQCKIEELYCEVKKKRGKTRMDHERQEEEDVDHRLSVRSTSTGSSLLSDMSQSEPLSCSSPSEANTHPPLRHISADGGCRDRGNHLSTCFQADNLYDITFGAQLSQSEQSQAQLPRQRDSFAVCEDVVDTSELDAFQHETFGCSFPQQLAPRKSVENVQVDSQGSPVCAGPSYNSDKKKNTTALNAALREIALVSEELCSYQDEIRKKSGDKRPESLYLLEENEIGFGHDKTSVDMAAAQCDLNQIYIDFRALEKENWITLSLNNTLQSKRGAGESWVTDSADPSSYRSMQMSPGVQPEMDTAAPPLPPRSSSRNLSIPLQSETELYIPDTPVSTTRKCHNPCVLVDRKCSSPSIVKKFEAMLQENEGKVLIDGELASCSVPSNSNCSTGCCHNRWSCDASKLTSNKPASYGTVQKSFSEVNIRSAGKDLHSASKSPELQVASFVRELPVDLLLSSLETAPVISNLQASRRNLMLERKTAEFNKTLFQAEMGRGLGEQDHVTPADTFSVPCQSVHTASQEHLHQKEMKFQTHYTDATTNIVNINPEVALLLSLLDSTVQSSEVQPRETSCAIEVQEVRKKQESPSAVLYELPQTDFFESSQILAQHCDIKPQVETESSAKKKQLSSSPESIFFDSVSSTIPKPGLHVDNSSSTKENSNREKPQLARSTVSLQQVSAENKQRAVSQAKHVNIPVHQPDSSRPGPRMMNDHPWKPLTLAAYPRPEGSRSNYGAVEKILKNYESAARAQKTQNQVNETPSCPMVSLRLEESITEMNRMNMDPLSSAPTLRHTQTSHVSETHITHAQLSGGSSLGVKEIQLIVQENEKNSSSSVQKNFSRPACPANRRLPSRWASRSPTSSSSASPSPSSTPVVHPSFPQQKHTSSFTYIETVII